MDGKKFCTQMGNLAMGIALNAAARDYQKEMVAHIRLKVVIQRTRKNFMDHDSELGKLHAERIATMKREAEKRQKLQQQGYGEC